MVDRHHPGKAPTALLQRLAAGECLLIDDLAAELDLTNRQVSNAAALLIRRAYLQRAAVGCYRLTDAGMAAAAAGEVVTAGPVGPHTYVREARNTLRQRAWSAMRIRGQFTVPDLISDAATPGDANPADNLQRYLRTLAAAGYIAPHPRRAPGTAPTSNGFKRWLLARNTGPRAPAIIRNRRAVHDFNTGEDVPCIRA